MDGKRALACLPVGKFGLSHLLAALLDLNRLNNEKAHKIHIKDKQHFIGKKFSMYLHYCC